MREGGSVAPGHPGTYSYFGNEDIYKAGTASASVVSLNIDRVQHFRDVNFVNGYLCQLHLILFQKCFLTNI
ncbi:UNVERIFIED_CONTAM: hypothetical protein K2H54_014870 [Gekko kuhli]